MSSWNLQSLTETLLIGSTLVEGSTLTENQARDVLVGKTLQGHPVQEIRELLNYQAAVEWLMNEFAQAPYLSVDLVQSFHLRLFQGFAGSHGTWKAHKNYTFLSDGKRFDYLAPALVPIAVQKWVKEFNGSAVADPAEGAARLYYEFETIHPFEDGNGRIGRILVRYWLHWKFQLGWEFYLADKVPHLKALEEANHGRLKPLIDFFRSRIK